MTIQTKAQDTHTLFLTGANMPEIGTEITINGKTYKVTGGNPKTRKGPQVWFKGQGFHVTLGEDLAVEIAE